MLLVAAARATSGSSRRTRAGAPEASPASPLPPPPLAKTPRCLPPPLAQSAGRLTSTASTATSAIRLMIRRAHAAAAAVQFRG